MPFPPRKYKTSKLSFEEKGSEQNKMQFEILRRGSRCAYYTTNDEASNLFTFLVPNHHKYLLVLLVALNFYESKVNNESILDNLFDSLNVSFCCSCVRI